MRLVRMHAATRLLAPSAVCKAAANRGCCGPRVECHGTQRCGLLLTPCRIPICAPALRLRVESWTISTRVANGRQIRWPVGVRGMSKSSGVRSTASHGFRGPVC